MNQRFAEWKKDCLKTKVERVNDLAGQARGGSKDGLLLKKHLGIDLVDDDLEEIECDGVKMVQFSTLISTEI